MKNTCILSAVFLLFLILFLFFRHTVLFSPTFKWKIPIAALASMAIIGVAIYLFHPQLLYYDAFHYNHLADIIFTDGKLTLSDYPQNEIRGYIWPLIIGFLKNILYRWTGNSLTVFYLFSAVLYGILFSAVLPTIMHKIFHYPISCVTCVLPTVLILMFWGATIWFPLSDLPAVGFLLCAILALLKLIETHAIPKAAALSMIIGVMLYAAYNTRTMYIFLFALLPLLLVRKNWSKGGRFLCICMVSLIFGSVLVALPQMYINLRDYSALSPMVITGEGGGLFTAQLQWGMEIQRYETYVGLGDAIEPGIRFQDIQGSIALRDYFHGEIHHIFDYIGKVFRHPLAFLGIYTKHFINVLNHCYPELYIFDLQMSRAWLSIVSYTGWFIGGAGMCCKYASNRGNGCAIATTKHWIENKGVYLFAILFAPIVSILGALEIRFFLAGYLLLYYYLIMGVDYDLCLSYLKKNTLKIIAIYIIGISICMAVWPVPSLPV